MNAKKYNLTLPEIIGITIAVVVFSVILFSVSSSFRYAWGKTRQLPCTSNLRQLAMAVTMYSQDNKGRLPDIYKRKVNGSMSNIYTGWVDNVSRYVKLGTDATDYKELLYCNESPKEEKGKLISYGYNSCMLNPDGSGINEKAIKYPTRVGLLCDASPGIPFSAVNSDNNKNIYGGGGIIGGYSILFSNVNVSERKGAQLTVYPIGRHSKGVIAGYADGHAQIVVDYSPKDSSNGIIQSFYMATTLGLVDNPGAGLGGSIDAPFGIVDKSAKSEKRYTIIGGDAVTRPILRTACEAAKKMMPGFYYKEDGFNGSLNIRKRPADYIEGVINSDFRVTDKSQRSMVQIGVDAMVVVVNKNCAIKNSRIDLDKKKFDDMKYPGRGYRQISLSDLQSIIQSDGCSFYDIANISNRENHNDFILYIQNKNDASRIAIADKAATINSTGGFGTYYKDGGYSGQIGYKPRTKNVKSDQMSFKGRYCNNDMEIVDKVANDTLGIGIVSAAFADQKKVDILAINFGKPDETVVFPTAKGPGVYTITCRWPFQRILYARYTPGKPSGAVVDLSFIKYKRAFFAGPLYKASYWPVP